MGKWYNVELEKELAETFKIFLRSMLIKYESSECFNLTHFEIYATSDDAEIINSWLAFH